MLCMHSPVSLTQTHHRCHGGKQNSVKEGCEKKSWNKAIRVAVSLLLRMSDEYGLSDLIQKPS